MTGLLTAIGLFIALTALLAHLRSADDDRTYDGHVPKKLPNPGARDIHAVSGTTLSRAHVPSWG